MIGIVVPANGTRRAAAPISSWSPSLAKIEVDVVAIPGETNLGIHLQRRIDRQDFLRERRRAVRTGLDGVGDYLVEAT